MKKISYIVLIVAACSFAFAQSLKISAEGNLVIEGRKAAVIDSDFPVEAFSAEFEIVPLSYPLAADKDPAFEMIVNPPISTDKIRFISNDRQAHVTEIRFFESGMPRYPDVMEGIGEGLDVPNFALGAKVTASSRWDVTRDESRVVDGSLAFDSRWVSGGSPPHTLTIDMGTERVIGCIQMVSGYLRGTEWNQVASDFYFEYFDGENWNIIPGSGRRADAELSSFALTLSDNDKKYLFIHRRLSDNWAVGVQRQGSDIEILEEFSLPMANIYENQNHFVGAVFAGDTAVITLDGLTVLSRQLSLNGQIKAGFESLSSDAAIEIIETNISKIDDDSCDLLKSVELTDSEQNTHSISFNPLKNNYQLQLPQKDIKRIRVQAAKAFDRQSVKINGEQTSSLWIDVSKPVKSKIELAVTSPDKSSTRNYTIEILPVPPSDEYVLAFSEDFEGDSLDTDKWFHRTGTRWESIQRAENIKIEDGRLVIVLEVDEDGQQYTGGIITNEAFGYGYYETSVKLWKGTGWHSAFWQMQAGDLRVNEIDCFESVSPTSFSSNLHYYRPRHIIGAKNHYADVASDFNVYAWEWMPDRVRFYFNGELIRDVLYPGPHLPQNVWLSCVAHPDASTEDLPGTIEFEYFRYYKRDYMAATCEDSIIIDTKSGGYSETGIWADGKYPVSHRSDFETRLSNTAGSSARWQADIDKSGLYEIYVWNAYVFPDKNIPIRTYTVQYSGGLKEASIRPSLDGQRWVLLGSYELKAGIPATVSLDVRSSQPHRADGVMFKRVRGE